MRRSHRKASIHHPSPQTQPVTSPVAPTNPRETRYAHRYADIGVFDPRQSTGAPLEPDLLRRMEAAFESDFSEVRLRIPGDTAHFEALAMARGEEIHLQPGAFDPHSASGLALLGHELAHVVQQRQGRVPGAGGVNADPGLEAEATDHAGRAVSRGSRANLGSAAQGNPVSGAVSSPVQRVWAKIVDGKVNYDVVAPQTDINKPLQGYTWMTESEFVTFKNAGKRHASNKLTDKTTGTNYFTKDNTTYYTDKQMKTQAVNAPVATNLIDRRRTDRTNSSIELYDVATYKEAKKHEQTGDRMEHDHVPSGQSRKEANPKLNESDVYNDALAIEIRGRNHADDSDHAKSSPTYGGRQQKMDTVNVNLGTATTTSAKKSKVPVPTTPTIQPEKNNRPTTDAQHPGAAYYRDVDTMLTKTTLPARGKTDQLQQIGAYRQLYKQNIKKGVIDPKTTGYAPQTGYDAIDGEGVTFETKKDPLSNTDRSQGSLIDEMLNSHLAKRAK
ncbi:MAG: DUF4157 domain-containing protein [Pleurocapsa sp. SU_196_0]|nr:DUF4157 domain-containing protein [Pleurocapsa sp. SU_196_0]